MELKTSGFVPLGSIWDRWLFILRGNGSPTPFDRALASQYGQHAVRLVEEERFGEMVTYNPPQIGSFQSHKPSTDCRRSIPKVPLLSQPKR